MITIPIVIIINLLSTFEANTAPIGAAITPPTINPKTICQLSIPTKNINTPVLKNVTTNSAVFTVPIVSHGFFP